MHKPVRTEFSSLCISKELFDVHDPIHSNPNGTQPSPIKEMLSQCQKTFTSIKNSLRPDVIDLQPEGKIDETVIQKFIDDITPYLTLFYNALHEKDVYSDEDVYLITDICNNEANAVYEHIKTALNRLKVTKPLYPKYRKDLESKYKLEIYDNLEECRKALNMALNMIKPLDK